MLGQVAFKINLLLAATLRQQQSRRSERMDGVSWLSETCVPFQKHRGVTSKASFKGNTIEGSARKDLKLNRELPHCIYYWECWFLGKAIQVQSSTERLFTDSRHLYHTFSMFTKARGATVIILIAAMAHHSHSIRNGRRFKQRWAWNALPKPLIMQNQTEGKRRAERVTGIFQANCKGYISDSNNKGDLSNTKSGILEWANSIPAALILFSHIK